MFDIFISTANMIFPRFFPRLVIECFVCYNERPVAVNELNWLCGFERCRWSSAHDVSEKISKTNEV